MQRDNVSGIDYLSQCDTMVVGISRSGNKKGGRFRLLSEVLWLDLEKDFAIGHVHDGAEHGRHD